MENAYICSTNVLNNLYIMNTLTIQVESSSVLEQLKNILSLMKGVKIVTYSPQTSAAALEDFPNAATLSAMKEIEKGYDAGTVRMDSLEGFIASMEA